MEVFLIFPESEHERKKIARAVAQFHCECITKYLLKLPCSTAQKLELVDMLIKKLRTPESDMKSV